MLAIEVDLSLMNSLIIVIIAFIIVFAIFLVNFVKERRKSFKENLKDYKETIMTIIIDEEEKRVERYYSYQKNRPNDYISLDEFFLKFDAKNLAKLQNWIECVKANVMHHNIELVMYDENNKRRVYMISLDKLDTKKNRMYLTFSDVTESLALQKRIDKNTNVDNLDAFYGLVFEKIKKADYANYLIAIKYREYKDIEHALKGQFIQLIDSTIYTEIKKEKFDNDLLCIYKSGVILLCAFNVNNEKKLKTHIRKILSKASKTYMISKNRFSVTLVAGMRKIEKNEENLSLRVNEAIMTCDELIRNFIRTDHIKMYDINLAHKESEKEIRNNTVLNIVNKDNFSVIYKPFIDYMSNAVIGYHAKIKLPALLNLQVDEFLKICKESGIRKSFFVKFLNNIYESKYNEETFYISINFLDLERMLEAYNSNDNFKTLKIVFCIYFSNVTSNYLNDMNYIEKNIKKYKEGNLKFGLDFNSLQSIYLNENLYEMCECILLSDNLIKHCLDNYNNNLLLDMYAHIAKKYKKELFVSHINSLALYEFMYSIGANYVCGDLFDNYLIDKKVIDDKNFLARLEEAKSKNKEQN